MFGRRMQKTTTAVWPPTPRAPLQTLLLCFVLAQLAASVRGQPHSDSHFISIDCGTDGGYNDSYNQIAYSSDAGYIDTGVNKRVSGNPDLERRRYYDLRSFPNGTRNCYTLSPLQRGKKYLVRASFNYGNYDGLNQSPEFDLYLGVDFWQTVITTGGIKIMEIMVLIPDDFVHVCLVNTGGGTPFISALELRPLADSMYPFVNASQSLVLFGSRQNYGGKAQLGRIRYPDDPYDRIWFDAENGKGWFPVSAAEGAQVKTDVKSMFLMPSAVMGTAVTTASIAAGLNVTVTGGPRERLTYLIMHIAELRQLGANESNAFDIYANGTLEYKGYVTAYLQADELLYTKEPGSEGEYTTYSLVATANSTVTPILNAHEMHYLQRRNLLPTDDGDVDAMLSIKRLYKVRKNWEGDPCAPKEFMWEDLNCSSLSDASTIIPRIISLNLSSSGLTGGIPDSIVNLTALKSLDLSYNNFTGEIPGFLGMLPALRFLYLSRNQLSGAVPQALVKKSQDGSLFLSVNGNPNLCEKDVGSCEVVVKKKKNILVPIIVAASASLLLLLVLVILLWVVLKRRRKSGAPKTNPQDISPNQLPGGSDVGGCQFTFAEIAGITNNFEREIGRGGFGSVYHGCLLPDGAQVAVKTLSKSSRQGAKQFLAEAHVLTRVHHRNLVSLLGYCDDENNLALVYEFMPQGSLHRHLSAGNPDHVSVLSWRSRLRIALDVAQGLDYLHSGCHPPIVHGDVKAANILLDYKNNNMGAKLADFGLSKVFADSDATHVTTAVVGTIGYVDPECYRSGRLNEKSDVYSFGVVLLELVTGRPPIISQGLHEKIHIAEWVRSMLDTGDITSIADYKMGGEYDVNAVWKVVEIAKECTESSSADRPTMSEVVIRLKGCSTSETTTAGDSTTHNYLGMQSTEMDSSTFGPSPR